MPYDPTIPEEELKNRVARDVFGAFDCARIFGKVDFCVSPRVEGETLLSARFSVSEEVVAMRKRGVPVRHGGPDAAADPARDDPPFSVEATPDVLRVLHRDPRSGEWALLLENYSDAPAPVALSAATGSTRPSPIAALRARPEPTPAGFALSAPLPPHSFAAVRFR